MEQGQFYYKHAFSERKKKCQKKKLFTSESVTEGHPDKICDQISDAVLDDLIRQDPMSRVAYRNGGLTGIVFVMGEITSNAYSDIKKIARDTIREIGYNDSWLGFDCDTCGVLVALDEQSKDIAMGVDNGYEIREHERQVMMNLTRLGPGIRE